MIRHEIYLISIWYFFVTLIFVNLFQVSEKLKPLKCKCLGGGKIDHDQNAKRLEVYGISQGFGKADHDVAAALLKKRYPNYFITVNHDDWDFLRCNLLFLWKLLNWFSGNKMIEKFTSIFKIKLID